GTELFAGAAFFLAAGSGEDAMAKRARQLNRGDADAAAAALHQQRFIAAIQSTLAAPELAALEDIAPDREKRFRQRCRLDIRKPLRHRQTRRQWCGSVFG